MNKQTNILTNERISVSENFKLLSYTLAFHCFNSASLAEGGLPLMGRSVFFLLCSYLGAVESREQAASVIEGPGSCKLSPAAARPACCTLFGFRCN